MIGLYRTKALRSEACPLPALPAATRSHGSSSYIEVRSTVGSARQAAETAELLFARCADDLPQICEMFGVDPSTIPPLQVTLCDMPHGMPAAHQGTQIFCDVGSELTDCHRGADAAAASRSCFLVATQLVQLVSENAGTAWSPLTAQGQALSRVLTGRLYPRWRSSWTNEADWVRAGRPDIVNEPGDSDDISAIGGTALFLEYLHHEFQADWRSIVLAGADTPSATYRTLTGRDNDPWPAFVADHVASAKSRNSSISESDVPESGGVLAEVLAHRRWWIVDTPVRHLRVDDVFVNEVYEAMVATFRERKQRGDLTRSLKGYDASAAAVTPSNAGGFSVFLSREWHDMIAALLDVPVTGDVIATLHHHAAGSASGTVHNDLNPGWFPVHDAGEICVHDPAVSNYRSGASTNAGEGVETVERTRAISLLFYLDTPEDVVGGGTGFYRSGNQNRDRPDLVVPPRNNSLIAFECTPFSFHTFLTNAGRERNCLVMWLHRHRADTVERWGEQSIVGWT